MDFAAFKDSLAADRPPRSLAPPLKALWWATRDWSKAHEIAQAHDDASSAWVHAYLHRVEGDSDNAAYWYRRAGRPVAKASLPDEWAAIVRALLNVDA
jgi:hypothetical protein